MDGDKFLPTSIDIFWVYIFTIVGTIVSIILYLTPLPSGIRIYREGTTGEISSTMHVAAIFNAALWIYYSSLVPSILMISVNSSGCLIEIIWVIFYLIYAPNESKKKTMKLTAFEAVLVFGIVVLVTYLAIQSETRIIVVGVIASVVSLCNFVYIVIKCFL